MKGLQPICLENIGNINLDMKRVNTFDMVKYSVFLVQISDGTDQLSLIIIMNPLIFSMDMYMQKVA